MNLQWHRPSLYLRLGIIGGSVLFIAQPFVPTASLFLVFRLGRLKLHSDILFSNETQPKSMRSLPCTQDTQDLYLLCPVKIHILV